MEITNPSLNASLSDSSKNDDSFTQTGTTVNIGSGAVYNQNCGNAKEMSRRFSMWLTISVSFICDLVIIGLIFLHQERTTERIEAVEQKAAENISASNDKFIQIVQNSAETHKEMMARAKEGTIWLLRDDIMKTIDFHEATGRITQKQYKRLKDEYEYYVEIGGNHDVKDRFEDFFAKIYGTGTIKMVAELAPEP